jgi:hypothetical protein
MFNDNPNFSVFFTAASYVNGLSILWAVDETSNRFGFTIRPQSG